MCVRSSDECRVGTRANGVSVSSGTSVAWQFLLGCEVADKTAGASYTTRLFAAKLPEPV